MRNYIGAKRIIDTNTANIAGVWTLDDITFMRSYNIITDSRSSIIVEQIRSTGTWKCPVGVTTIDYLVLAGGGGGGSGTTIGPNTGGGGGAGGIRIGSGLSVTPEATYITTIGAGGAGGYNSLGSTGSASFFGISPVTPGGINADGGGGGCASNSGGGNGGCGGGGTPAAAGGLGNRPNAYTPVQGYDGTSTNGGGAGGPAVSPSLAPLYGGQNVASSITGVSVGYGAGGCNSGYPVNADPNSAGGTTAPSPGIAAAANFGGGGGGCGQTSIFSNPGGTGGSGRIIVKYTLPRQNAVVFGNTALWTVPSGITQCDWLVVGGGGGGGFTGGGGAGGLRTGTRYPLVPGNVMAITIGAGGSGTNGTTGGTGGTSSFGPLISSTGGGGGGDGNVGGTGAAGGSGGGAGSRGTPQVTSGNGGAGNSGGYYPIEGFGGGSSVYGFPVNPGTQHAGGGGGGAGASGNSATGQGTAQCIAGNGGIGLISTLSGSSQYYSGGGGGYGTQGNGVGGSGGGGTYPSAGTARTGGGGSATSSGGSGIVILRLY